ncbi:hypothetical protein EDM80_14725 [bacterium]|nr:MAG: hypothetical protein EDM80_14725 [bacterium]RIK63571.1 MAG: hypothetical protein DCC64_06940 [Planctomycetota bacterium]
MGLSLPHQPRVWTFVASLLLLCLLGLSAACSATGQTQAAGQAEPPRPAAQPVALSPEYEEGRSLYNRKCGTCHELYAPREFAPHEWPRYVKRYGPRSGLRPADREKVTAYLQWAAAQP